MQKIYCDLNIFIDYMEYYTKDKHEHINLVKKINSLAKNYLFLYSPAHIEEVAVIYRKAKNNETAQKYINQHCKIFSKITKNKELLPTNDNNGIVMKNEEPQSCMQRVLRYYQATCDVENIEKEKSRLWNTFDIIDEVDLNKIPTNELLNNQKIKNELIKIIGMKDIQYQDLLKNGDIKKYIEIKDNYQLLEAIFEIAFDVLDFIGFKNDKKNLQNEKYRSRVHDITHSIYATASDIFVTNDRILAEKAKIIYSFLEVETIIMLKKDFINNNS